MSFDPVLVSFLYLGYLVFVGNIVEYSQTVHPMKIVGAFILGIILYVIVSIRLLIKGMTPGKWLFGEKVIDQTTGNSPGLGKMLIRETLGKFISGSFMNLGFFWAIWDRNGQTWHDKMVGTVVVQRPSGRDWK